MNSGTRNDAPPNDLDVLHLIGRHVAIILASADSPRLLRVRALLELARDEVGREALVPTAPRSPPR